MTMDLELEGMDDLKTDLEVLAEEGDSDRVELVGSDVEYGVYLEFGTQDMQPYSWFRPAVREFEANPISFVLNSDAVGYSTIDEVPDVDALITAVAQALVSKMEKNVSAMSASDRSPGTHPDHPKVGDTGNLKASIDAERIS